MGFYTDFAGLYDKLISYTTRKRRELPFWRKLFSENRVGSVLDCSCGTGHHLLMFGQMGLQVQGSDLSRQMLQVARNRLRKKRLNIPLIQSDFRQLTAHFNTHFDAVVNLGNLLPYLASTEELDQALRETFALLNDSGIFVLSLRNYDKMMSECPSISLVVRRFNHAFIYAFEYPPEKIVFNIIHVQFLPRRFATYKTEYYPLYYHSLMDSLARAGFCDILAYQDFDRVPFNVEKSDHLVLACKKQAA